MDQYLQLLAAVLGGGALFKFLEKVFELVFHSGKSLRDELREEIKRLEGNIKSLEGKVDQLEAEVETWKSKVDAWRVKYYALLEQLQTLKLIVAAKDVAIGRLKAILTDAGIEVPDDLEPPTN